MDGIHVIIKHNTYLKSSKRKWVGGRVITYIL